MSKLDEKAKTKVVILGSCKYAPYEVLLAPNPFDKKLYVEDHEKAYAEACKHFYPAIKEADVVFVYVPDGIGQHTKRDLDYAKSCGKLIGIASKVAQQKIAFHVESVKDLLQTKIAALQLTIVSIYKPKIESLERERGLLKQSCEEIRSKLKFLDYEQYHGDLKQSLNPTLRQINLLIEELVKE